MEREAGDRTPPEDFLAGLIVFMLGFMAGNKLFLLAWRRIFFCRIIKDQHPVCLFAWIG